MEAKEGVCMGCLFPAKMISFEIGLTNCCKRPICRKCLGGLTTCPVCRDTINHKKIKMQPGSTPLHILLEQREKGVNGPTEGLLVELADQEEAQDTEEEEDPEELVPLPLTEDGTSGLHKITQFDTLVGVSLKYGVSATDIRKANKMFSSNIQERKFLIIPGVTNIPRKSFLSEEKMQQIEVKRLMSLAGCDKEEARFYLEQSNFEVDKALALLKKDLDWEHATPPAIRA